MMKSCLLRILFLAAVLFSVSSCKDRKAQNIVDRAIKAHGGRTFESFVMEFDFRNRHYTVARNGGLFNYEREFDDTTGHIKEVLNNEGYTRYLNNEPVSLPDDRRASLHRSLNAVVYFVLLPFGLNDKPVVKEFVEETRINDEPYDVVRVTFKGGSQADHDDIFLYWFHREKATMDYFAYSYKVDGGGVRFREAVNPRETGGILVQDYLNYKPEDETLPVDSMLPMFLEGRLEKLSEIRMENIVVRPYDEGPADK